MLFSPPHAILPVKQLEDGIVLFIKAFPGSSKKRFGDIIHVQEKYFLKVYIHEPAVNGCANQSLIQFLSNAFNVKKSSISILKGITTKEKQIFIKGLLIDDIVQKIFI